MRILPLLIAFVAVTNVSQLPAQEVQPASGLPVYQLDLTLREGAGKTPRRYRMVVEAGGRGSFRSGTRVPVVTGSAPAGPGVSTLVATQYQYLDAGVSIDCKVRPSGGKVALSADLEISSIVQHEKGAGAAAPNPTVAQFRLNLNSLIDPGRPVVVATLDDQVTMQKIDVEATVTKLN